MRGPSGSQRRRRVATASARLSSALRGWGLSVVGDAPSRSDRSGEIRLAKLLATGSGGQRGLIVRS